ncbi:MAG: hypothetical protein QM686_20385 [Herbaspirillum sp.]
MEDQTQKKYDRLLEAVRKMRGHQKEYFKYRAKSDLEKSRYHERQVDQLIKEELEERKSLQSKLF